MLYRTYFLNRLCLLLVLTLPFSALAQSFRGGIMAGITGSQMDGDNLDGFNKLGFSAGIFANRDFNEYLGMQMELKFIMKGASKSQTNNDPTIRKRTSYYYELPVLVTLRTANKVTLETGLAFAVLSKSTADFGMGVEDRTNEFNKTDISWIAGLYYFLNNSFSLNLKFSYSLKRVSYYPGNQTLWGTFGQYNNLLDFSLYYTLHTKNGK
jgi:hypothetical protein